MMEEMKKQTNLELALIVDEQILRFEIAVEDAAFVTVSQASEQLEQKDL